MDTYGKTHQKRYQHKPSVGIWLIRLLIPLGHRPENERSEEGRHGINFTLNRREPERVTECVCKRSDSSGTEYNDCLGERIASVSLRLHNSFNEEHRGQIQKKYRESRKNGIHRIYSQGCMLRTGKHSGKSCKELEYRVSRRVSHLQLI